MCAQTNPASPTFTSSIYHKHNLNGAMDVDVVGDRAYVVTENDYITVIGVADPANMFVLGSLQKSTELNGAHAVVASSSFAYVASRANNGIAVVDLSDSASLSIAGTLTSTSSLGSPEGVFRSGDLLYVANYASTGVTIVDVSTAASPVVEQSETSATTSNANRVVVSGTHACAMRLSSRMPPTILFPSTTHSGLICLP